MQTRKHSLIEQLCNVGSGFAISLIYWSLVVVPQIEGMEITAAINISVTLQFTVLSVIRGYCWRRGFNWWQHRVKT